MADESPATDRAKPEAVEDTKGLEFELYVLTGRRKSCHIVVMGKCHTFPAVVQHPMAVQVYGLAVVGNHREGEKCLIQIRCFMNAVKEKTGFDVDAPLDEFEVVNISAD